MNFSDEYDEQLAAALAQSLQEYENQERKSNEVQTLTNSLATVFEEQVRAERARQRAQQDMEYAIALMQDKEREERKNREEIKKSLPDMDPDDQVEYEVDTEEMDSLDIEFEKENAAVPVAANTPNAIAVKVMTFFDGKSKYFLQTETMEYIYNYLEQELEQMVDCIYVYPRELIPRDSTTLRNISDKYFGGGNIAIHVTFH